VLRIPDILVWIRIRIWIRGSMPLTNGSGSGSCYFVIDLKDAKKINFYYSFFLLISFLEYIYIIFNDKKSKRSYKAVGIMVFITISAW
jgi:hypothetical protein